MLMKLIGEDVMQSYFSKIYWHFTGGPAVNWADIRTPKEIKNKTKSSIEAVQILKQILSSRKLLATCTEKIMGELRTNKFCCVCDIPFKDLKEFSVTTKGENEEVKILTSNKEFNLFKDNSKGDNLASTMGKVVEDLK